MNALKLIIKRYEILAELADKRNDVRGYWKNIGAAEALQELENHLEKKNQRIARSPVDDHSPGK